jgi:hypothetical protein
MEDGLDGNTNSNGTDGYGGNQPEWAAIMKYDPAKTEVSVFLAARGRHEVACAQFAPVIEEFRNVGRSKERSPNRLSRYRLHK